MKKKKISFDGPPINVRMRKEDYDRLITQSEHSGVGHSTLARQYIIQRMNEEDRKHK